MYNIQRQFDKKIKTLANNKKAKTLVSLPFFKLIKYANSNYVGNLKYKKSIM